MVFLLAVWTARLAITKGRNGWTWGAAALILGLLPWHLIGAVPVLALMFIKTPVDSAEKEAASLACARCNKSHSVDQHFCTGCGWDLHQDQTNTPELIDKESTPLNFPTVQTTLHSSEIAHKPESTESALDDSEAVSRQNPVVSVDEPSEVDPEIVPEYHQEEYVPWGTYDVGEPPTAAVMVSRGTERFNEGKFQEAIDQFTKAIILDPNYIEAWERRSEAYTRLGRPRQAEDDRRHLQGLDPSSSPG